MGIEKGDVVTYKELGDVWPRNIERKDNIIKDCIDNDIKFRSLIIICKSCGHKDCVEGMRVPIKHQKPRRPGDFYGGYNPSYKWTSSSKPNTTTTNSTVSTMSISGSTKPVGVARTNSSGGTVSVDMSSIFSNVYYEDFLKCPKCGSRAITLSDDARKRIIARKL